MGTAAFSPAFAGFFLAFPQENLFGFSWTFFLIPHKRNLDLFGKCFSLRETRETWIFLANDSLYGSKEKAGGKRPKILLMGIKKNMLEQDRR